MDIMSIFATQFLLSLFVVSLIAHRYLAPQLARRSTNEALSLLLLPHMFRHLGLIFLVPGLVGDGLGRSFASMAAYGDLAAALLAIGAWLSLRANRPGAIVLVWVFNVVGTVDLANALRQAENVPELGVAWLVTTFIVPLLLVTHFMIFARLLGRRRDRLQLLLLADNHEHKRFVNPVA